MNIMLRKLTKKSYQFNRSICHQYDVIVNCITTSSKTTDELVELEKYIDNLRTGPLLHLKVNVSTGISRRNRKVIKLNQTLGKNVLLV